VGQAKIVKSIIIIACEARGNSGEAQASVNRGTHTVALSPLFHCKALFGTSRAVEIGKASNLDSRFASRVLRSLSTICIQARQCVEGRDSAETVGSSAQDLSVCIKLTTGCERIIPICMRILTLTDLAAGAGSITQAGWSQALSYPRPPGTCAIVSPPESLSSGACSSDLIVLRARASRHRRCLMAFSQHRAFLEEKDSMLCVLSMSLDKSLIFATPRNPESATTKQ
jgi:hypothetical protein